MKRNLSILFVALLCWLPLWAQLTNLPDTANPYPPTELDWRLLSYSLEWLDTTSCAAIPPIVDIPDSVYMERLCSLPCIVEMSYNSIVQGFINAYLQRNWRQVANMRRLGDLYFPLFEEALYRYGLPEELKYLPVIESGLNVTARSPMGAAGLWQFMPQTGKNSGLEINSLVDERLDPIKATDAACRFLMRLYNLYDDWNLAIAAYNCGPGNVNKAIHRAGEKRDFWDIYPFLPRETRSYLPIFVAANYVFNFADKHNLYTAPPILPLAVDTILTEQRIHLMQVAEVTGIPLTTLRRLNPQYTWDILPGGKPYALCLPIEMAGTYILQEDSICAYKADSLIHNRRATINLAQQTTANGYSVNGVTYYKIKQGDTLGAIAKKFHCSVAQLQKWNGLKSTSIRAGKTLKIYK